MCKIRDLTTQIWIFLKNSYNIIRLLMNNGQTKVLSKEDFKSKSDYKIHKRKTKNKLVFLVGLHVFLIFCFCILVCIEYLTQSKSQHLTEIMADGLYVLYFVLVLFSVKYKIRYLMMLSIAALAISAGLKIQLCVVQSLENHGLSVVYMIDVIFVLLNCIVPWRFLILWNQLKDRKWRETFDLRFKLSSHLLDDKIETSK